MFTGCQNSNGCRKMAVHTVEARRDGTTHDSTECCAYCVDGIKVPRGFSKFVDGERVTGNVRA